MDYFFPVYECSDARFTGIAIYERDADAFEGLYQVVNAEDVPLFINVTVPANPAYAGPACPAWRWDPVRRSPRRNGRIDFLIHCPVEPVNVRDQRAKFLTEAEPRFNRRKQEGGGIGMDLRAELAPIEVIEQTGRIEDDVLESAGFGGGKQTLFGGVDEVPDRRRSRTISRSR